jgi:hypothetical protein
LPLFYVIDNEPMVKVKPFPNELLKGKNRY